MATRDRRQNPPRTDRNGKNCRTETGACQPNKLIGGEVGGDRFWKIDAHDFSLVCVIRCYRGPSPCARWQRRTSTYRSIDCWKAQQVMRKAERDGADFFRRSRCSSLSDTSSGTLTSALGVSLYAIARHSRGLGWRAPVSDRRLLAFRSLRGGFRAPVSGRHFQFPFRRAADRFDC
jgi:hypothetical protein